MAQRLLVIKPSSLGDVVHALTVIQTLRRSRTDIIVDWVIRSDLVPVILHSGLVDKIYEFHRSAGLRSFFQLIQKIRKTFYDILWDMQGLARSGIITYFAHAKRKIGRKDSREGAFLAYHERVGFTPSQAKKEHAIAILAHFLPTLGAEANIKGDIDWKLPPKAGESMAPYIALFPETRGRGKEWPYFPNLAKKLLQNPQFSSDWKIKIFGHRNDSTFEPHLQLEDLRGQTNLEQLLSIIKSARCVVANDSGPVHIAASMRTPIIGLYGPTSGERFGPYPLHWPFNTFLQVPNGDLNALSVDSVVDKILRIIALNEI
jgi:ADP-heptose:LPS heptosyltransferase